ESIPFDTKNEAHLVLPGDGELGARAVDACKPRLVEALIAAMSSNVPPGPVAAAEAALVQPDISASEATEILRETVADLVARVAELEGHVGTSLPGAVLAESSSQQVMLLEGWVKSMLDRFGITGCTADAVADLGILVMPTTDDGRSPFALPVGA